MLRAVALIALALVAVGGCDHPSEDLEEVRRDQREILFRLGSLAKAIEQAGSRAPTAATPGNQPPQAYEIALGESPVKGRRDAPVTIVEFSDFQCPWCKTYQALMNQVLQLYPKDVKLVYKEFPLAEIHANAVGAAKAALAAARQGKFWEMHDMMYQNQDELGMNELKQYAQNVGLDVLQWQKDFSSPEVQQQLTREADEGRAAGVDSTPSFFVNGRRITAGTIEEFKSLIQEALNGNRGKSG
jgi:protein-disulfide isomerase